MWPLDWNNPGLYNRVKNKLLPRIRTFREITFFMLCVKLVWHGTKFPRKFTGKFIRNWEVVCLQRVLKCLVKISENLRRSHKLVQASLWLYNTKDPIEWTNSKFQRQRMRSGSTVSIRGFCANLRTFLFGFRTRTGKFLQKFSSKFIW
jgi:hypothetical protein